MYHLCLKNVVKIRMVVYQTLKKTFSLKSDNKTIEQANLAGVGKEKGRFILILLELFYFCLKKQCYMVPVALVHLL
jgi:hypothetical protein